MSRNTLRTSFAALAMAIAAGVAVVPAQAAPDAPKAGQHRGPMQHDGFWIPGLGPLSQAQVDSLNLDAKQKALFDKARDAQRESRQAHQAQGSQRHALLQSQLQAGKLDPRALTADADKRQEQRQTESRALRTQSLAAWDSLNDTQRSAVTQMIKARVDAMQTRHEGKGERRHRHGHGGMQDARS